MKDSPRPKDQFSLVYEDENIAAFNKSSGLAVKADRWDINRERLDKLAAEFLGLEKVFTVHRLDRETSGLVVFAKNPDSHRELSLAFETRSVEKRYIAIVRGRPSWKEYSCDLPLVPNGNKKHLTIVDHFQGKKSLTHFSLIGSAGNYSVLNAIPETGRTHQIRVHLTNIGYPIVCDEFYGNSKGVFLSSFKRGYKGDPKQERPLLSRLGLHALSLFFPSYGNEGLALTAPILKDMAALIKQMEKAIKGNWGF